MRLRLSERAGLELSRSSSLQGRSCPADSLDRLRSARIKNGREELNEKTPKRRPMGPIRPRSRQSWTSIREQRVHEVL